MVDYMLLTRFTWLVMRLGQMRETVSDLVSILVDVQHDAFRRGEWYLNFPKFMSQKECRVTITSRERFFLNERTDRKLGRMMEAIGRLPGGALLRMLRDLTAMLGSENGNLWYWELLRFLSGKKCWSDDLTKDEREEKAQKTRTYFRTHFVLRGNGYDLITYERIRTGTLRQNFESIRWDGRLDKLCLQSLQAVKAQSRLFGDKLRSIRENDAAIFLYQGEEPELQVADVDLSWSGDFEIVKRPYDEVADTIFESMEGRKKSRRRIVVVLDLP